MSICIFGVPSPQTFLAALYARFVSSLANPGQSVHRVKASSIDVIRTEISNRPNDKFVFTAFSPNEEIIEFALSQNIPIAISIPPMRLALTSMMSAQKLSLEQAIEQASYTLATLAPLIQAGQGMVLPRIYEYDSVVPLISGLAKCLSFNVPQKVIPSLLKRIAGPGATRDGLTLLEQIQRHMPNIVPKGSELRAIFQVPASDTKDAVRIASLAPVFDAALSAGLGESVIEWPVNFATTSTSIKQDIDGIIELTGKARTLIALPPLHFYSGRWRAAIELSIDGNQSGNFLTLQAIKGRKTVSSGGIILPDSGKYATEIEFDVPTPRDPVAIRMDMKFGAIEGTLKILRISFISKKYPIGTPHLLQESFD